MRILHLLSYSIFSGPMPGTLGLMRAQCASGDEVYFAHDRIRGPLDGYEEALEAHHIGTSIIQLEALAMSPKAGLFKQLKDLRRLRIFAKQKSFDCIHCHLSHDHALAAATLYQKIPIVRSVHARRVYARKITWPLFQANALIARSSSDLDRIASNTRKNALPGFVIPGGVTLHSEVAHPPEQTRRLFREALNIPEQASVLLHCGLMADRGQAELIATMTFDNQLHVFLAGDGPDYGMLKILAKHHHVAHRVHFLGYLPFPALAQAYLAADLAIVFQAGNDGRARAALEAIDFGLPLLVVSDGGPLDALASAKAVKVSPTRAPTQLWAALAPMLQKLETLSQTAKKGRSAIIAKRTFEQEALETKAVYHAAQKHFSTARPS